MPNAFQQINEDVSRQSEAEQKEYCSMLTLNLDNATKQQSKRLGELMNKLSLTTSKVEEDYKLVNDIVDGLRLSVEVENLKQKSNEASRKQQEAIKERHEVIEEAGEKVQAATAAMQAANGKYDEAVKMSGYARQEMRKNPMLAAEIQERHPALTRKSVSGGEG